jgi:hypothetical protein
MYTWSYFRDERPKLLLCSARLHDILLGGDKARGRSQIVVPQHLGHGAIKEYGHTANPE